MAIATNAHYPSGQTSGHNFDVTAVTGGPGPDRADKSTPNTPAVPRTPPDRLGRVVRPLPGLGVALAAAMVAYAVNRLVPVASPLLITLLAGALIRNLGGYRVAWTAGLRLAGRPVLRAGVMLLGLQLALSSLLGLGIGVVVTMLCTVALTFPVTTWLGMRLGLRPARALLVSTGVSICGASAIVAMKEVADADEDDVAVAVATVTILGTVAIAVFPVLDVIVRLRDETYGAWTGASVHEVGQVVAIGGVASAAALQMAIVVKLGRVILLAPLVAVVGLRRRRGRAHTADGAARVPVMPWFVAGFLVMVAVRGTGWLSVGALQGAGALANVLLAAALFALGVGVDVRAVARGGGRALAAGALGTLVLMLSSLGGLVLFG
jgi:uncharacterized integral membrane protein (TIGR00698 family)